jgi:hypothetical protein
VQLRFPDEVDGTRKGLQRLLVTRSVPPFTDTFAGRGAFVNFGLYLIGLLF